jgi:AcrR family transcriptional regulator
MMNTGPQTEADTRERLLDSAGDVFAAQGYRDATVKQICEAADANIAAVNYYFGSKENLYAEAWRRAFHRSQEAHPSDGGVPEHAPPEERLRGRIRALIHKVADEDNQAFRIAHKEMAEPTGLLKEVRRECLRPVMEAMAELIRELLGSEAPPKCVNFCQASIAGQCFGVVRHAHGGQSCGPTPPPLEEVRQDVDGYAEHVFRFSLAGIEATREFLEAC